ncbi:hypothetical protein Tco_0840672 [Tanacetum coccineum]|uniref:Uncharacterized protein n=1 Tax=Tanacetum coccineum TaxID=301880 RepID=A0ABQ5AUN8_9ASTR
MGAEATVGLIEAGILVTVVIVGVICHCMSKKPNRSRAIQDIETRRTSQTKAPATTRVINNAVTEARHVKPDAAEGVLTNGDLTKAEVVV